MLEAIGKSDEKEKSEREPLELYTKKRRLMDNVEKSHREARVKEVKPLRMKEEKRRRTPEKTPSNEEEKSKRRFEDKKNVEQETEGEKMTSRPVLLRRKFDTRRIEQKNEVADEEMLVVDQSIM